MFDLYYAKLTDVIGQIVNLVTAIGRPNLAMPLVRKMIFETQSDPNQFTVLHTDFLKLCYNGRFYNQTLPMINTRLTSIRPYYKIEPEKGTAEESKADKNANK